MFKQNEVLIAGRALWEFGARMVAFPTFTTDVDSAVFQGLERSSVQLLHLRQAGQHMDCEIDYFGSTLEERTRRRGALEAILFTAKEPVEIDIGDGYFYRAVPERMGRVACDNDVFTEVEYRFRVTKHTAPQTINVVTADLDGGWFTLWCQSTVQLTDCLVKIPLADLSNVPGPSFVLSAQRWYFNDLEITDDIVLDGISKVFRMGSQNITNHEEFIWSTFPALQPGRNTLSLFADGWPINTLAAPILLSYTPTYL